MASFNKVILMGRLCAEPELKQTPSGVSVTSFSLAVDRKGTTGEEKKCDFINIVAWRQTAEFINKYFSKGSAILLCGELQTRSFESQGQKRYVTEVVANEVSFCEAKRDNESNSAPARTNAPQRANSGAREASAPSFKQQSVDFANYNDDDLPF